MKPRISCAWAISRLLILLEPSLKRDPAFWPFRLYTQSILHITSTEKPYFFCSQLFVKLSNYWLSFFIFCKKGVCLACCNVSVFGKPASSNEILLSFSSL